MKTEESIIESSTDTTNMALIVVSVLAILFVMLKHVKVNTIETGNANFKNVNIKYQQATVYK